MRSRISSWLCAGLLLASCGTTPTGPEPVDLPANTAVSLPTTIVAATQEPTSTPAPFILASPGFDAEIPRRFACTGEDLSPELIWGDPPAGTQSFALLFDDPGAPWVHWLAYNLPPELRGLPEDIPAGETLPVGGLQGLNSWNSQDYRGPCPPQGTTHTYSFILYALDIMLPADEPLTKRSMMAAMDGHILAQAELRADFTR